MGTRHLICAVVDGEYKVAQYGQWDGYPDGKGVAMLNFLRRLKLDVFAQKLRTMITPWDEAEMNRRITEAGGDPKSPYMSIDVADRLSAISPETSRDTSVALLSLLMTTERPLMLQSSLDFASDSLFCEWAYVIDLDKNTFEVYRGFNKRPVPAGERFADFPQEAPEHRPAEYYPIKHLVTYPLDKLPTKRKFLSDCKKLDKAMDRSQG